MRKQLRDRLGIVTDEAERLLERRRRRRCVRDSRSAGSLLAPCGALPGGVRLVVRSSTIDLDDPDLDRRPASAQALQGGVIAASGRAPDRTAANAAVND